MKPCRVEFLLRVQIGLKLAEERPIVIVRGYI